MAYSNEPHTEEIDLREVYALLKRYRRSTAAVTAAAVLLALVYLYFATPVYQAGLSLQVRYSGSSLSAPAGSDFMSAALDAQGGWNIDDEIAILRSYAVVSKALEYVPVGTRYYAYRGPKSVELYTASPFRVTVEAMEEALFEQRFIIEPLENGRFRLLLAPTLKQRLLEWAGAAEPIEPFEGEFGFGETVEAPGFRLKVERTGAFDTARYAFTAAPNAYMAAWVQEQLSVSVSAEKGSVLYLGYEDNVPRRAVALLNAVAQAYKEQSMEAKAASARKTLAFIDAQIGEVNATLQGAAERLQAYRAEHGVIDPKAHVAMLSAKLSELGAQYDELGVQRQVLEGLWAQVDSDNLAAGYDLGAIGAISAPIVTLIQKLQETDSLLTALRADYTDRHPDVIKALGQMGTLRANLKGTIESNVRSIDQRMTALEALMEENRQSLESVPAYEKELSGLTHEFEVNQKVFEYLRQKRAETAIVESSTVSAIRVIDRAMAGAKPAKPKKALILLVALVLGVAAGFAQVFGRSYLHNTIESIGDLEKPSRLPLLAVLPFFSDRKSLYHDALRVMLSKFEFGEADAKPSVLVFTSSVKGEGRTTTAVEFARVAAASGKKVALLDANLRHPKLNAFLELPPVPGVSDVVAGRASLEEACHAVGENLDAVTAGSVVETPYDVIVSQGFAELLESLRERYDYVVVLGPPTGVVADALVLMRRADLNLMVFRAGYSKRDFVKNTNRLLEEHALENVGVLLTALDLKKIRPWRAPKKNRNG